MSDSEGEAEIDLTMVTMTFDANDIEAMMAVLSKYVVVSRQQAGCRNIDVGASTTVPGRFFVVQKWDSASAQQAHFDSEPMVEMAQSCQGILSKAPVIDLVEPISVHDLN